MATQVIVVPEADVAVTDGTVSLTPATDHKLLDANASRVGFTISVETADAWVSYGTDAAVVGQGVVVRAGGEPLVETAWKGEVHVISASNADVTWQERTYEGASLADADADFVPSGPSDDYFETAVASTPDNLASTSLEDGGWLPNTDQGVQPPQAPFS